MLDEESNFPKATDLTFASKLDQHLCSNPCFKGGREGEFSILHYAGQVSLLNELESLSHLCKYTSF